MKFSLFTGIFILYNFFAIEAISQTGGNAISYQNLQGKARIDSLMDELSLHQVKNTWDDSTRISILIALAYDYHRSDPELGIQFGKEALDLSKKLDWKLGIASAGNRLGLCYWAKGDFPTSLEQHFGALKISEESDLKEIRATILGNIGLVFSDQVQYEKALEYHLKALEMNRQLKNQSGVARNLGNIGIVYDSQGEFDKALKYYSDALQLYEELSDKGGIARNLGNIGYVYQEKANHSKALEYYYRALIINEAIGNKILMAQNLGNIGEEYFNIASEYSGKFAERKEAILKSAVYLKQSISIFEEIEDRFSLSELYLYLSNLHILSGDYKSSMDAYKKHIASRDSVFSESNSRQIVELEKIRETDLKQKELELKDLALSKSRDEKKFMLAGLILLACLAILIFNQYRIKQKSNIKLTQALTELKNTQQQLVRSERFAAFGIMAARVAHEIMNPLNFINNFSEIARESVEDIINAIDENERKEHANTLVANLKRILEHGKRAENIVKQVLEHTRTGTAHEFFDQ